MILVLILLLLKFELCKAQVLSGFIVVGVYSQGFLISLDGGAEIVVVESYIAEVVVGELGNGEFVVGHILTELG